MCLTSSPPRRSLGDGIAIKPGWQQDGCSVRRHHRQNLRDQPCVSLESDSGIELFVHFGIDTVELKGEGFTRIAQEGQQVKRGDTIIESDLAVLGPKPSLLLTPWSSPTWTHQRAGEVSAATVGVNPGDPHQATMRTGLTPGDAKPARCFGFAFHLPIPAPAQPHHSNMRRYEITIIGRSKPSTPKMVPGRYQRYRRNEEISDQSDNDTGSHHNPAYKAPAPG